MDQTSRSGITGPMQLQALIADLNWRIQLLNSDIAEENVSGGASRSMLAQHLKARHNNLVATVAMLEKQLASIGSLVRAAQPTPQGMRRRRRRSQPAVRAAWNGPVTSAPGLNGSDDQLRDAIANPRLIAV
ncbi:hypothetical protein [Bradyrhizobium pachyrhizi]|uniref:hypothetical protein n=1 Tax=Bradyrhizobium pachyrhizi TaxID=280333 RepID=UPI0018DF0DCF|nr:hypothetical protein [Bradyrhizobium pachyrhizi]